MAACGRGKTRKRNLHKNQIPCADRVAGLIRTCYNCVVTRLRHKILHYMMSEQRHLYDREFGFALPVGNREIGAMGRMNGRFFYSAIVRNATHQVSKIAVLLLLVVVSNLLFAQTMDDLHEGLEGKDFSKLKFLIENIQPSDNCASPDEMRSRVVLKGYDEVIANIVEFVPTPQGKYEGNCNFYQLNLLVKGNEVIGYALYSKSFDDSPETYLLLRHFSNDDEIMNFRNLYERTFYRKPSLSEFFDDTIVYGSRCGIIGKNPEARDSLDSYIQSRNREKLFEWLTSPSYEKKLYAYEGYLAMMKKGYVPSKIEKSIINRLGDFSGEILTCSGCTFWTQEYSALVNQIKER